MAEVKVKEHESFEIALKKFKKKVQDAGLLTEMRKREYYEPPRVRRKRKQAAAARKAQARNRLLSQ